MLSENMLVKHSRNIFCCRWQELCGWQSNTRSVEPNTDVARQVSRDIDDVLDAVLLLSSVDQPVERLFDKLVDLLVESLFLSLRAELADGLLERGDLVELAARCQELGLLPLRRTD